MASQLEKYCSDVAAEKKTCIECVLEDCSHMPQQLLLESYVLASTYKDHDALPNDQ